MTSALTLACQTLRARPRARAVLLARLDQALEALQGQGFQLLTTAVDTFTQDEGAHAYPICGYSRSFVDPDGGSALQLRVGLQLGSPDQGSFLCGFVLQVLRPDTVAPHDLIARVLSTEFDRRILCEVSSSCMPGLVGWDRRGGVLEVEELMETLGVLTVTNETGAFDAKRLAEQVVQTLQP